MEAPPRERRNRDHDPGAAADVLAQMGLGDMPVSSQWLAGHAQDSPGHSGPVAALPQSTRSTNNDALQSQHDEPQLPTSTNYSAAALYAPRHDGTNGAGGALDGVVSYSAFEPRSTVAREDLWAPPGAAAGDAVAPPALRRSSYDPPPDPAERSISAGAAFPGGMFSAPSGHSPQPSSAPSQHQQQAQAQQQRPYGQQLPPQGGPPGLARGPPGIWPRAGPARPPPPRRMSMVRIA